MSIAALGAYTVPLIDMRPRLVEKLSRNDESTFSSAQSGEPLLYQRFGDSVMQPFPGTSVRWPAADALDRPVVMTTWTPSSCGHPLPEQDPEPFAWNWRSKLLASALWRHDGE